jgi:hypothetical protein
MSERDKATIQAEDARAMDAGLVGSNGYRVGRASGHRAMIKTRPTSRRPCSCGCGKRQTHVGLGDGVALMGGCELRVRRWVRDGS